MNCVCGGWGSEGGGERGGETWERDDQECVEREGKKMYGAGEHTHMYMYMYMKLHVYSTPAKER